jgi:hypothetical protein
MKRRALIFSVIAVLLSLGISVLANDLVHLKQKYIGEDNPKNQKWIARNARTEKRFIDANVLCKYNDAGINVEKYKACSVKYFTTLNARKPFLLKYKRADKKFYLADENTPYDSGVATYQALEDKKYARLKILEDTRGDYGSYPAIWVMDPTGRLYVSSTPQPGMFNHSSFLGGGSVICAGEIIIEDGKIKFINNRSGHYEPEDETLDNAIAKLLEQGVELDGDLVVQKIVDKTTKKLSEMGEEELEEGAPGYGNINEAPQDLD